jgi:hypothetical protein
VDWMILESVEERFQLETGVMREARVRVGLDKRGMIASELRTIGIALAPEQEMVVETPDAAAAAVMVSKSVMAARLRTQNRGFI